MDLLPRIRHEYQIDFVIVNGENIKNVLEDVADNLFNIDPYYQQGGDMVRVGGLKFAIDPTKTIGNRVTDMELNGKKVGANKKYRVAGWASVSHPRDGQPIWEIVEEYLLNKDSISVKDVNLPKIKGLGNNVGYVKI